MIKRLQALWDVGRRHGRVLRNAWRERRGLEPRKRTASELAFLPAQLELVETPVSAAPRWSMRIIIALFAFGLLWACVGKLDIVAVAPGKTVTLGRTKVIQPIETSVVRKILVHDGQQVHQGDLLLELDAAGVSADAGQAAESLTEARIADLRASALISAMDAGVPPKLADAPDLSVDKLQAAQQLASGEFSAFEANWEQLAATVVQKQAELRTTRAGIEPLEHFAKLSRERLAPFETLVVEGYVSRQDYLLREQELVNAERDASQQRHHLSEVAAALAIARQQLAALVADTRKQLLDQQRQARDQIRQFSLDVERTAQRRALMQLRAPVDGTVQQLAVHTVGGVVTPAQSLMAIVPMQVGFEVEASVLDKDIGFVKPGQTVVVKLVSFPYTRYGYLTGTVETISHDAAQDDKLGLVFPARIKLNGDALQIDGTSVRITAGMGVSAEIKTGKRRVIDYLLSPLKTHVDGAMRER
ncbi:MAG: HlyD family type I secretion periplasmic adaptor subunit [Gammaproteobacteria bacterium]